LVKTFRGAFLIAIPEGLSILPSTTGNVSTKVLPMFSFF